MKKLILLVLLVVFGWVLFVPRTYLPKKTAPKRQQNQLSQIESINAGCTKVNIDGFGEYRVKKTLSITNKKGRLTKDCRIILENGARLNLENVQLDTKKLIIEDTGGLTGSEISLNKVSLKSIDGGFQIKLKGMGSKVAISGSSLVYPLSVGVAVGSGEDSLAGLDISNSTLSSVGQDTEGIVLVSTGMASVKGNHLVLTDKNDGVLLVSPKCEEAKNYGAILSCIR